MMPRLDIPPPPPMSCPYQLERLPGYMCRRENNHPERHSLIRKSGVKADIIDEPVIRLATIIAKVKVCHDAAVRLELTPEDLADLIYALQILAKPRTDEGKDER